MLKIFRVGISCRASQLRTAFYTCQCLHLTSRNPVPSHYHGLSLPNSQMTIPQRHLCHLISYTCKSPPRSSLSLTARSPIVTKWQTFASKSRGRGRKSKAASEDDDDDDDESSDDEDVAEYEGSSDDEWNEEEASSVRKTWKDLSVNVPSLRIDAVLSSGLGISRKKIEDAFFDAHLKLNAKVISKKSKTVKEGDVIDVLLKGRPHSEAEEGTKTEHRQAVMRVVVVKVREEKTLKGRVPVKLRRWKYLEIS